MFTGESERGAGGSSKKLAQTNRSDGSVNAARVNVQILDVICNALHALNGRFARARVNIDRVRARGSSIDRTHEASKREANRSHGMHASDRA